MRTINAVKFKVQTASIANHFAAQITTPNCCRGRTTICTRQIFLLIRLIVVGALGTIVVVVTLREIIRARPNVVH
jgi:hypothetical protein